MLSTSRPAHKFSGGIRIKQLSEAQMTDPQDKPQIHSEEPGSRRDPEERPAESEEEVREKMLDKTLADSFPTSDPPSSIPDPATEDEAA
jgi:hypothetical protein